MEEGVPFDSKIGNITYVSIEKIRKIDEIQRSIFSARVTSNWLVVHYFKQEMIFLALLFSIRFLFTNCTNNFSGKMGKMIFSYIFWTVSYWFQK